MKVAETMRFDVPGGLTIAGEAMGPADGQPVLLLHGGGQTRRSWKDLVEILAEQGYRAYAIDARGHGESDYAPDGQYTPDTFTADLRSIVAQIGGAPVLVGASLGGITGLLVAGEQGPGAVSALVLVDVAVSTNPYGVARIQKFMRAQPEGFASVDEAADAVAAYASDRPRPASNKGLERNLRKVGDRYFWHWDPRFLDTWHPAHTAAKSRLEQAASSLTIPVQLIHAGKSDVIGQAEADQLRTLIPQLDYVKIENAGHMVVGDRHGEFNRTILDFLAAHSPPKSN